jgi:hypothetical protein
MIPPRRKRALRLALWLISLAVNPVALDAAIHVALDATGSRDGTSWDNAFTALQAGLDQAAVTGEEVWVAAGVYRPNQLDPGNLSRAQHFSLPPGVSVFGGFAGTETERDERDPWLHRTILTGDLAGDDEVDATGFLDPLSTRDNCINVVRFAHALVDSSAGATTTLLDGFELTGASAEGSGFAGGAAIWGSIRGDNTLIVRNCHIVRNYSSQGGAGINLSWMKLRVERSIFRDNRTSGNKPGTIYINGTVNIEDCVFEHNKTSGNGGALFLASTDRALHSTILNSSFIDNAASDGGALFTNMPVLVENSTFDGNVAAKRGGAVAFHYIFEGSRVELNHVTLANNRATLGGGAIAGVRFALEPLLIRNSILWNNSPATFLRDRYRDLYDLGHSIIGDATATTDGGQLVAPFINDADPRLLPIAPRSTRALRESPVHVVLAGSPAIAAADPETQVSVDQVGTPRTSPATIGSVEYSQTLSLAFVDNPTQATALAEGMTIKLEAITNVPPDEIEWWLDGQPAGNEPTLTVTIPPALESLTVHYTATAGSITLPSAPLTLVGGPARLHVDADEGNDAHGGESWSTATQTVARAMDLAVYGTFVLLKGGTHTVGEAIQPKRGTVLRGGFAGTESTPYPADPYAFPSILSGDRNGDDLDPDRDGFADLNTVDNADTLMSFRPGTDIGPETRIEFLTFSGSRLRAVLVEGSGPGFAECRFIGNGGQAVHLIDATATFEQCHFERNAVVTGPTTRSFASQIVYTDCVFTRNGPGGQAVSNDSESEVTWHNCTFFDNHSIQAGALVLGEGTFRITNSTFSRNTTAIAGPGAILTHSLRGNEVTVLHSTFLQEAPSVALIQARGSTDRLKLINCLLQGNSRETFTALLPGSVVVTGCVEPTARIEGGLLPLGLYGGVVPVHPLPAGSAVIGQGTALATLDEVSFPDVFGRPRGSTPTAGAVEPPPHAEAIHLALKEDRRRMATGRPVELIASADGAATEWRWFLDETLLEAPTDPRLTLEMPDRSISVRAEARIAPGLWIASPTLLIARERPVFVDAENGDDAADGSSWNTALRTLSAALDHSEGGAETEFWLAQGTYHPPADGLRLLPGMRLFGGFKAGGTGFMQRDPSAFPSVLSGDLEGDDLDLDGDGLPEPETQSDNAAHVLRAIGISTLAEWPVVDGLTIVGGASESENGGAFSIREAHVDFRACRFVGNRARHGGGGFLEKSSSRFRDCQWERNTAAANGGGLHVLGGAPDLVRSRFTRNSSFRGGGLFLNLGGATTAVSGCVFDHNFSEGGGGGIFIQSSAEFLAFQNCLFTGNRSEERGGAVEVFGVSSPIEFRQCTFASNRATFGGGISGPEGSGGPGIPFFLVRDSIIWNNLPSGLTGYEGFIHVERSILQPGDLFSTAESVLTNDPHLLPFGDYGGPLPSQPVAAHSPAIAFGEANHQITADARGFTRPESPTLGAAEWQRNSMIGWIPFDDQEAWAEGIALTLQVYTERLEPTLRWQRNGVVLAGETSPQLQFTLPPGLSKLQAEILGEDGLYRTVGERNLQAGPARLYVDAARADDLGDGTSWASARRTLQSAFASAPRAGQIWVRRGIYRPNDPDPARMAPAQTFAPPEGREVYGGFAGTELTLAERDIRANPTILSGDLAGDDADSDGDGWIDEATTIDNAHFVVGFPRQAEISRATILDGVILEGAGIAVTHAAPTLRHLLFRAMHTSALQFNHAEARLESCVFTGIRAKAAPCFVLHNDHSEFVNCVAAQNESRNRSSLVGALTDSHTAFVHCTFIGHATAPNAQSFGINNLGGNPRFINSIGWIERQRFIFSQGANIHPHASIMSSGLSSEDPLIDPLPLPLGYFGGSLPSVPVVFESTAVDAADAALTARYGIDADGRGFSRSEVPDIGAFEVNHTGATAELIVNNGSGSGIYPIFSPVIVRPKEGWEVTGWGLGGAALFPLSNGLNVVLVEADPTEVSLLSQIIDTDSDGIADLWEMFYFDSLQIASRDTDFDHDGQTDLIEYLMGTDPRDRNSRFQLAATRHGAFMRVGFPLAPGRERSIWSSVNLEDWSPLPGESMIDGAFEWWDFTPQSPLFFNATATVFEILPHP